MSRRGLRWATLGELERPRIEIRAEAARTPAPPVDRRALSLLGTRSGREPNLGALLERTPPQAVATAVHPA